MLFFWSYLRTLFLIHSHECFSYVLCRKSYNLAIAFNCYFPFLISTGFFIGISLNKDINWGWNAILTVLSFWIIKSFFYSAMLYGIQCIYLKINFLLNWFLFLFELLFILLYYYTMYTIIHEISFLISLRDYLLLITKIQLIFGHWSCIKKYTLLNLPVSWFWGIPWIFNVPNNVIWKERQLYFFSNVDMVSVFVLPHCTG